MFTRTLVSHGQMRGLYLYLRVLLLVSLVMQLSCSDSSVKDSAPKSKSVDPESIPDAVPRAEPRSKYGNPESYVVFGKRYHVMKDSKGFSQRGIASWYGKKFHGRKTSNGETYDMYAMTAAHKKIPLPAYVEVINLKNKRRIIVRVNDRGPFHENRIIDLSYSAALKLDIVKNGTGLVEIRVLESGGETEAENSESLNAPLQTSSAIKDTDGFYIQVGAFVDAENARSFQNRVRLISKNNVEISEVLINGKTVYRVQIGPINNVDTADRIVAKLGEKGINEHQIVVR
ncbi:MAG: septal ring lytic transglycosylase RlpA family protein [Gammaproteobacteria bacterium]|jgi:rare lipoprotein A|nr:septal ring lytic transglycosylase RlpA family protein [Gammaproteobacteria bacterium]